MSKPETSETESEPRSIDGIEGYSAAVSGLFSTARREVRLLSYNLDQRLYGGAEVYEQAKNFLLISQHSRLKILLNETRKAAEGHRLVELGRRLSSFVEFRVLPESERELVSDWMIVDESSLLIRRRPEAVESRLWDNVSARARRQRLEFDALWEQAEPTLEFRSIGMG